MSALRTAEQLHRDYVVQGLMGDTVDGVARAGSGASVVFHAARRRDRADVAVKVIAKSRMSAPQRAALAREVVVHQYISHLARKRPSDGQGAAMKRNVVQFVEAFEDDKNVYVVTEYGGRDLYTTLTDSDELGGLNETQALQIFTQLLAALVELHEMHIAHRDLKLENIVLVGDDLDRVDARIIDFGLAHWRRDGSNLVTRQFVGTPGYVCPEICSQQPYVPEESDMWSMGVLLYAMLTKKMPFTGEDQLTMMHRICHEDLAFSDPVWLSISPATKGLIRSLLHKKGSERPTAAEALALANACKNNLHKLVSAPLEKCKEAQPKRLGIGFDFLFTLGGLISADRMAR